MTAHVLGPASVREFVHQLRPGLPFYKQIDSQHWADRLNELEIREREYLSNGKLVAQLTLLGPRL